MQKIDAEKLFKLQLNLEGFDIGENNQIIKINTDHFDIEKDKNQEFPNITVFKSDNQLDVFYADSMSDQLVFALEKFSKEDFFYKKEKVIAKLKERNEFNEVGHYIVYIFPEKILENLQNLKIFKGDDELVKEFDSSFYKKYSIIYAAIENNEIAASCVSSRENDFAGEAWIFTSPKYRKQGYGSRAVNFWAHELREKNKIPFYTHEISNIASHKLAQKLGLVKVLY